MILSFFTIDKELNNGFEVDLKSNKFCKSAKESFSMLREISRDNM
jgi:hypothetical protein